MTANVGLPGLLAAISRTRVCIVGDVLLDVFTRGYTDRTCPDAPALVVREHAVSYRPSGAALAAQPLRSLGAHVHLVTALGDDDVGRQVRRLIEEDGTMLSAVPADRPTPCKHRIIAAHPSAGGAGQLLLRLDREETSDVPAKTEAALIDAARRAIGQVDAVLLSDYGKGVCTAAVTRAVIEAARTAGIPVVVDPKHPGPQRYRGATILTPNTDELVALTGTERRSHDEVPQIRALAEQLRRQADANWVLATRAAAGMSLIGPDDTHLEIAAYPREVVDVAGAGDVLAAVITAAAGTCSTLTPKAMARVAVLGSLAAGVSLRHEAHKRITAAELLRAAEHHDVLHRFLELEVQRS
jgi:D-beta-D-heptose 7-phosphate kinase/D-beta-D-heptose 1-phosphate adenosyltransferase